MPNEAIFGFFPCHREIERFPCHNKEVDKKSSHPKKTSRAKVKPILDNELHVPNPFY